MIPHLIGIPAFVHVAEQLSFRGAARILGVTPTAVSKSVSRLEARLGTKLLHRTSRHVSLTREGELYFRRCREALDLLSSAEDEVSATAEVVRGPVKISLSFVLGQLVIDHLSRLMSRFPEIEVHLSFTDRDVRLAEEEVDVAVRIGTLPDSSLVARKLRETRWATVASPSYLARAGAIGHYTDLADHRCLRFARPEGGVTDWQFRPEPGAAAIVYRTESAIVIDQGDLLVRAAATGLGVVQAFDFMVGAQIARGELVEVLRHQAAEGPAVHALTLPGRSRVPRIRAIVDHLEEMLKAPR